MRTVQVLGYALAAVFVTAIVWLWRLEARAASLAERRAAWAERCAELERAHARRAVRGPVGPEHRR